MNIAFLTSEYPHPKIKYSAGISTSIKNLATELVKRGQQVTIFVYSQDKNEIFVDNGVSVHKIKHIKYFVLGWYLYRKQIQNYINKITVKEKIELIEAPDWTGITAFMHFNCSVVIRLHGSDAYFCNLEGRKQKFKNYLFEKIALKSADAMVSVSDFTAIKTKEIFKIKSNISIISNGIDLKKFKNDNTELFETNTLLYFGTIIRKKGILELAKIFNELINLNKKVNLYLIGNDVPDIQTNSKSTYYLFQNELSAEAKLQANYLGAVNHKSLINYIKKSNLCLLPSLAETFGMVTIEAMALQKTVITSDFGWNKEIIENGLDGILVNPKNHKKIAKQINYLLKNKTEVLKIGKCARIKVENCFNIENIAKQNIKFYQSILKR